MGECIVVMEEVLAGLARGECQLPLRQIMWLPDKVGALGLMPAYWSAANVVGLKAVSYFPGNEGSEYDSHQGAVMLFDAKRGRLLAMIDATSITAIRTAAVSGVATKLLARKNASRLAVLGSGVQAREHVGAMCSCRSITDVRVFSRTLAQAERFASATEKRLGLNVRAVASAEEAVKDADIVCTTTSSSEPVLFGRWINRGTHINAVGSSVASARELDAAAVRMSRLFVDRLESAMQEAGDFVIARKEGVVGDDHVLGEIGDLLLGRVDGRVSADDVTLFKSVGLAVEDLAAAYHVYKKAIESDAGTSLDFGGFRDAID